MPYCQEQQWSQDVNIGSSVWLRRVITVSVVVLAWALVVLLGPMLALLALVRDGLTNRRWITLRFLVFGAIYLTCELGGIVGALIVWVVTLGGRLEELAFRLNFGLQKLWAGCLFGGLVRVFEMDVRITGADTLHRSPVIVFSRHVSSVDTIIPQMLIARPHNIHLRYVIKKELLWDPCLDIVGGRLGNCFVDRGGDREEAVAQVRSLLEGLRPKEGVVIFPEGTRFTPQRKEHIIQRFREGGNEEAARRAESLRSVLPPRRAGVLALLADNPGADVVFLAHVGLETVQNIERLKSGSLVGTTLELECWRVPFESIPQGDQERMEWMWEHWERMDQWVTERNNAP